MKAPSLPNVRPVMLALMLATIDWALTTQVAATLAAAIAAVAAAVAARASRDAVRDQEVGALIRDLIDLHGRLTMLGIVLADDPVLHQFEQYKPGLGRHLAVIDWPLPNTRKLWRTTVPDLIDEEFEDELRSTHVSAMREVEDALAKVRRTRPRWWRRRRPRRVPGSADDEHFGTP